MALKTFEQGQILSSQDMNDIVNQIKSNAREIASKASAESAVSKNQGTQNAGKTLVVNSQGIVAVGGTIPKVDSTLKTSGAAADSKVVGDALDAVLETVEKQSGALHIIMSGQDFDNPYYVDINHGNKHLQYDDVLTMIREKNNVVMKVDDKVYQPHVYNSNSIKFYGMGVQYGKLSLETVQISRNFPFPTIQFVNPVSSVIATESTTNEGHVSVRINWEEYV